MGDKPVSRRTALAAGTGIAAAALAGCTEDMDDDGGNVTQGDGAAITPPTPPSTPSDEYWEFVIESLDYQNQALEQLLED